MRHKKTKSSARPKSKATASRTDLTAQVAKRLSPMLKAIESREQANQISPDRRRIPFTV